MMPLSRRLFRDRTGAAAAEMALVAPLLLAIMIGTLDLGYYFLSEHVVQKAVRDAARYAGRLPLTNFDCASASVDPQARAQIQKLARTGAPDGTNARLGGWTADSMTNVSLTCAARAGASYVNNGLFREFPGGQVPVVTVTATVPHPTLFGSMAISSAAAGECASGQNRSWRCLSLFAKSQSAVFGA